MESRVANFLIIFVTFCFLISFFCGCVSKEQEKEGEKTMTQEKSQTKKIAMIVAFRDFRDEEYFVPKEILENERIEVKTASSEKGTALGADGGEINIDLTIEEINVEDFDAVVFIGGPGCLEYLDNENSYKLIQEVVSQDKILGAICISPVILAKAGVLNGKRATVWTSALDRSPVKILEARGAKFVDEKVIRDEKIITGNGPDAAWEFGGAVADALGE